MYTLRNKLIVLAAIVRNVNDAIQPFQASNVCFGPAGSGVRRDHF
jgi:hypothetical protein